MNRSPYLSCTHEFCETFLSKLFIQIGAQQNVFAWLPHILRVVLVPEGTHRTWLASVLPFLLHQNRHYLDVIEAEFHRVLCAPGNFTLIPCHCLTSLSSQSALRSPGTLLSYPTFMTTTSSLGIPSHYPHSNLTQCHNQLQAPRPLSSGLCLPLAKSSIVLPSCINLGVCCSPLPILHKSIGSTFYVYRESTHFSPHSLFSFYSKPPFSEFPNLPTNRTSLSPYSPQPCFIFLHNTNST